MRILRSASLLLLALASPAILAGTVTVTHADPAGFRDAADRANDPAKVAQALARHLESLGGRYLAPQDALAIRLRDVDLAGRPRNLMPTEIRIVNGPIDRPCIELTWTLTRAGTPGKATDERVCDDNFQRPLGPRHDASLGYEKRMLEEWFQERFAKPSR